MIKILFFSLCLLTLFGNFLFADSILKISEEYWNGIDTMNGRFKQVNEVGEIQYGDFYIQKPFRSLFEYDGQKEKILTSKFFINIVDENHYSIDSYPIINNPIKIILTNNLKIEEHFDFLSRETENQYILEMNKKDEPNKLESIILYFNKSPFELKKWEIFNEFGDLTSLEFTKILKNIHISQDKFVIHHNVGIE